MTIIKFYICLVFYLCNIPLLRTSFYTLTLKMLYKGSKKNAVNLFTNTAFESRHLNQR